MGFEYDRTYTSSELPRDLVDVGSGEVRYYEGVPYRVMNTGTGGRRLERPSFTETGVRSQDRVYTPEETFQKQIALAREVARPAVEATKASIPITEQSFTQRQTSLQGRIDPLKERYKNILDDLTLREQKETESTTLSLNREYGRRGIPLSSGVYDQASQEALRPIRDQYGIQRKDVQLGQEGDIRTIEDLIASLPIEKAQSLNEIQKAIAALESGAGSTALTNAMQIVQQSQQNAFQRESQDKQLEQALQIAKMQNQPQSTPLKQWDFANLTGGGQLYNPYTGELGQTISDLRGLVGGGAGKGVWE